MHTRPTCVDCKVEAPETNTDYTLISAEGWRLARRLLSDGTVSFEWRCAACWAKHKERLGLSTGSHRASLPDSSNPSEREVSAPASSKRLHPPDSKKPPS